MKPPVFHDSEHGAFYLPNVSRKSMSRQLPSSIVSHTGPIEAYSHQHSIIVRLFWWRHQAGRAVCFLVNWRSHPHLSIVVQSLEWLKPGRRRTLFTSYVAGCHPRGESERSAVKLQPGTTRKPEVAEMLGNPPRNRGNLRRTAYLAEKHKRDMTCEAHQRD